ncbi:MAG: response regulator [Natronomonas sp.]
MTDSIRVLHVDDEPDFADMTARFLERQDPQFTVETASDSCEGMDRLEQSEYDCIVSDYEMPGQNGIEERCYLRDIRQPKTTTRDSD